jgi:hypothetical protein
MRGKKIDTDFLSNFIQESVELGYESPKQILTRAKDIVRDIDDEIKQVELSKIKRSKLLGVIASFDEDVKPSKATEAKVLPFYKLSCPTICKHLCSEIKELGFLDADVIATEWAVDLNIPYSVKQMIEQQILLKVGKYILMGPSFKDYATYALLGK